MAAGAVPAVTPDRKVASRLRELRFRHANEPLLRLGGWDWLFILFGWLTAGWFVVITLDAWVDGPIGFDFMPLTAGIPLVPLGWRAARLDRTMASVIRQLDANAGLVLPEGRSAGDLQAALARRATAMGWRVGSSVGLFMAGGVSALLVSGLLTFGSDIDERVQTVLLGVVLIGVGTALGYLLGRLVGYGGLFRIMDEERAAFPAVTTREARDALRGLGSIYQYAYVATTVLCHWFAAWLLVWAAGIDARSYRDTYDVLFVGLFGIAYLLFVLAAWRPCAVFRQRLDALFRGRGAETAFSSQIRQAEADRAALAGTLSAAALAEIDAFIADKKAEPIRSFVLKRWVLLNTAVWLALLLAVDVASVVSHRRAAPPKQPQAQIQRPAAR